MKQRTMYLFILILLSNLIAQDKDKSLTGIFPTASSVLDSLEQHYNRIEDYYVRIEISIKTKILRMPRKRVNFWFKQPNLTKVETKGFAAIPKSGIISSPVDLFDNLTNVSVVGAEFYNDKQIWILHGNLNPDSLMFRKMGSIDKNIDLSMKLWVDRNLWTLLKSETWMDTTKVVEIQSEYKSFSDDIHLPIETIIKFKYSGGLPSGVEKTFGARHQFGGMQGDSLEKDLSGMITLKFSDYKVNKGIENTFFEEEEPE
jgi:outer membrane lipoprotein-sorting protein